MLNNYLVDTNRFSLAGPPKYWLKKLWEFDPSLVVVPSRQGFYYRLAQRRKLQLTEKIVNDALFNESDTKMLASYSLVPVTTIIATADWSNPYMFVELANRAPWRMGGAAKVNKMIEAQERNDKIKQNKEQSEMLDYLARDSWNMYRKKIGLRTNMWSPRSSPVVPIETGRSKGATVYPAIFRPDPC